MRTTFLALLYASWLILGSAGATHAAQEWTVPGDYLTIQDANDSLAVADGDTIRVGPGDFDAAELSKSLHIVGVGGAVIEGGPAHGSGLSQGFRLATGSDGSSISHLEFRVDLAIMNAAAVDDVTIRHNAFVSPIQAVSDWGGNDWSIHHNQITDLRTRCGGGIGILVGDFSGGVVKGNVVQHNVIQGTLRPSAGDCGGYNGSGIVLYADFRGTRLGSSDMSDNFVTHNRVTLTSEAPELVDVVAFEMTESTTQSPSVIVDNHVGFNDWRGTALQMTFTPEALEDVNFVSRNLGDNRGHGAHPSLLLP